MSGQKKKQSQGLSKAERERLEVILADRRERVKHFHENGNTDTVWDADIARIEAQLSAENEGVKSLEVDHGT